MALILRTQKTPLPLFQSASIYVVTNAVNSAIPLLLLPVLTRFLSPEEYGLVAMFSVVTAIAVAIIGLGTHSAITREYYQRTQAEFSEFVGTCILILVLSAICLLALTIPFLDLLAEFSGIPGYWIAFTLLMGLGQLLCSIGLAIWQVRGLPIAYGAFQILTSLVNALLSLFLVISMEMGWQGRVIGQLAALLGMGGVAVILLFRGGWIKFEFSRDYVRQALRYGIPMVFHGLGAVLVATADRALITNMVGLEETGLYVVAAQIAMAITFLADSFNRAYAPWLFEKLKSDNRAIRRQIVLGTYQYFFVILLLAGALIFSAPWLLGLLVGPKFSAAAQYIMWLSLASAFGGMYYMVTLYIQFSGKTERLAAVTLSVGALHVLLCYVLVNASGAIGAAQATAISQLLTFLATWAFAARLVDMDWLKRSSFSGK